MSLSKSIKIGIYTIYIYYITFYKESANIKCGCVKNYFCVISGGVTTTSNNSSVSGPAAATAPATSTNNTVNSNNNNQSTPTNNSTTVNNTATTPTTVASLNRIVFRIRILEDFYIPKFCNNKRF